MPEPKLPTVVEVMAEHTDAYLWNRSPDRQPDDDYVVDPATLGVSPALLARLDAWNTDWSRDALGLGSLENRPAGGQGWKREGLDLAYQLQAEFDALGLDIDVLYAHDDDRRPLRDRRGR